MNKKLFSLLMIIIIIFLTLFLIRLISTRYLDDVSPGIPCDKELMKRSDVFFVIPKFNNHSISDDRSWCDNILDLNKTLVMHGVYHTYNEFLQERNESYLQEGVVAFEECFGFKPTEFKPPQLALLGKNKVMIENRMKLDDYLGDIMHKVYHCNDTGILPNAFVNWF